MSTALRLTVEEYDAMVASGAFERLGDRRVELWYGELREMASQGPVHSRAIAFLNRWSVRNTDENLVEVRVQSPIAIPEFDSEPEPDVVWSSPSLVDRHPSPAEIMLIIEVSVATLRNDLREKARLYARASIADYWVVDLLARKVHVYRKPSKEGFALHETFEVGDVCPLAFPEVRLSVGELFRWLG